MLTEVRQFDCGICLYEWWRVVPSDKPVSRCRLCHQRYDAIPRDKESQWFHYTCSNKACGREFYDRHHKVTACTLCGANVSRKYEGQLLFLGSSHFGTPHISTGSTVETWLSQTALHSPSVHRESSPVQASPPMPQHSPIIFPRYASRHGSECSYGSRRSHGSRCSHGSGGSRCSRIFFHRSFITFVLYNT